MKDEFVEKLKMYGVVRGFLRQPENQALWHDKPPYLTQRVADFESKAGALGAFGEGQSQTLTGLTDEQNIAEKSLEEAAHPLGRALRLSLRENKQLQEAAVWDMTLTDWRELRENVLLEKAKALHGAALPLTVAAPDAPPGTPPPGPHFGVTADKVTALGDLIDDYAEVIGEPTIARGERKNQTTALRPRFRVVDGILDDVDDLIGALRGEGDELDTLVDDYFTLRRIGGHSATPAAPAPAPAPPAP